MKAKHNDSSRWQQQKYIQSRSCNRREKEDMPYLFVQLYIGIPSYFHKQLVLRDYLSSVLCSEFVFLLVRQFKKKAKKAVTFL